MKSTAAAWDALTASSTDALTRLSAESGQLSQGRLKREFRALLDALSKRRSVLLLIDDLHWSDESTIDLLSYVGQDLPRLRLLILGTYRPTEIALEGHPFEQLHRDFVARDRGQDMALTLLGREEIAHLLECQFPTNQFPATFAEFLHARTEGSPIFIQGLVRYLQDRQVVTQEVGRWVLAEDPSTLGNDLPDSIASLIDTTLDQLTAEDRQLLQAASVQGAEFSVVVVADALEIDRVEVEERLQRIEQIHGLFRTVGEQEFSDGTLTLRHRFTHVLLQEALYSAITPSRRAAWSLEIARVLTALYGQRSKEIALELAFLYEQGRDFVRAIECLMQAAQRDVMIGANRESAQTCRRGLRLVDKLPPSPERDQSELGLQFTCGFAETFARGYGSRESLLAYQRAEELCLRQPAAEEQFSILNGLWSYHLARMDTEHLIPLGERIIQFAEDLGLPSYKFAANTSLGMSLLHQGKLELASQQVQAATCEYQYAIEDDRRFIEHMCMPFGPLYHCVCSWLAQLQGREEEALVQAQAAVDVGKALAVPQFQVHSWYSLLHYLRHDSVQALVWAKRTIEFSRSTDFDSYLGMGTVIEAWASVQNADGDEQQRMELIDAARAVLPEQRQQGVRVSAPIPMCMIGEALATLGRHEEAQSALAESLAIGRETGERWWEAETVRQLGLLQEQAFGDKAQAKEHFREAIEIAQTQGAKLLEQRSQVDLARVNRQYSTPNASKRLNEHLAQSVEKTRSPSSTQIPGEPLSPSETLGNLPSHGRQLTGREQDLKEVLGSLRDHRLVTIVGAGGVGKTSVAYEAARFARTHFPGGVWLVELAPVQNQDNVLETLAGVLDGNAGVINTFDEVIDRLRGLPKLLLVDNCEHVYDSVAELVERLSAQSSNLHILATSREALKIAGERVVRLDGLSSDDASALFTKLAADQTDFREDSGCEGLVQKIVERLEGLPLAIELAAPKLAAMSLNELFEALDDQIQILDSGRRSHDRQSTINEAVAWSFHLLDPVEQDVLLALSAFASWFSVEAAIETVGLGATTKRCILRLVEQSVLVRQEERGRSRYRLLEPIRQFCKERVDPNQWTEVCQRHAFYFAKRATTLGRGVSGFDELESLHALNLEWSDIRAATAWGREQEIVELAIDPIIALNWTAMFQLRFEAYVWLTAAAEKLDAQIAERPEVLSVIANGHWLLGKPELAEEYLTRADKIAPSAQSHLVWYFLHFSQKRLPDACAVVERAREMAEQSGDEIALRWCEAGLLAMPLLMTEPRDARIDELLKSAQQQNKRIDWPSGEAFLQLVQGCVAMMRGDREVAAKYRELAKATAQNCGNRRIELLARLLVSDPADDAQAARQQLAQAVESLRSLVELGEQTRVPVALRHVVSVMISCGYQAEAVRAMALVERVHGIGDREEFTPDFAVDVESLRQAVGTDRFDHYRTSGEDDSIDHLLAVCEGLLE